jgi:diaminopimelate epimerase
MTPSISMPRIRFTKMHGLGNDFVVLDEFAGFSDEPVFIDSGVAAALAHRQFGIGCDQLLLVGPSRHPDAHARMDIWNPDGSRAEMCGNGIRAVALYLHDHGPAALRGQLSYGIETGAGLLTVSIHGRQVKVNMGPPRLAAAAPERLQTSAGDFEFWEVSMGNPHAVIFVPKVDEVPLESWGPVIERHSRFEKRTNVEFVEIVSPSLIRVKVWERGAGPTLACGTGACASAVASILAGKTRQSMEVELPGGVLQLDWNRNASSPVYMTGPAVEVFTGETRAKK